MTAPLLRVADLSWQVNGKHILRNIEFSVAAGGFVGVIGANGAGKSSLLRCLYRYVRPSQGQVCLDGRDIRRLSARQLAMDVAVVLQETPHHFELNLADIVGMGLTPHKSLFSFTSTDDRRRVDAALEQVGLADARHRAFEHLSGGEKQRALIARAIVQQPRLLIMDEPTNHLDVHYQIEVLELARSLGITVLVSIHDLNLASAFCDELLLLDQGRLLDQGAPASVLTPERLRQVFRVDTRVTTHPQHGGPSISYCYQSQRSGSDGHEC